MEMKKTQNYYISAQLLTIKQSSTDHIKKNIYIYIYIKKKKKNHNNNLTIRIKKTKNTHI